jgi:hypothetical protein
VCSAGSSSDQRRGAASAVGFSRKLKKRINRSTIADSTMPGA